MGNSITNHCGTPRRAHQPVQTQLGLTSRFQRPECRASEWFQAYARRASGRFDVDKPVHKLGIGWGKIFRPAAAISGRSSDRAHGAWRKKPASWPVSRVLSASWKGAVQPFIWDAPCGAPQATNPNTWPEDGTCRAEARRGVPIRSCSRWGLPCRHRCRCRGGLLPHPFTLTLMGLRSAQTQAGSLLSVALSLRLPPPGVTRHRVSMEPGLSSGIRLSDPAAARPTGRRNASHGPIERSSGRANEAVKPDGQAS